MPESRTRKTALRKRKQSKAEQQSKARADKRRRVATPGTRAWVPPTFITVGLLGVLWLVVYYLVSSTGIDVPVMGDLDAFTNILIGMGAMALAFVIATLWK